MCFNSKRHQNRYMLTMAIPFQKKVCSLQISKPVRGARLKISVDRNSIEFQCFTHIKHRKLYATVLTLEHRMCQIRHQKNPRGPPSQKERTPRNQDIHDPKTKPQMRHIPPGHLTELYLRTILIRKTDAILVIIKTGESLTDEEVLPINDSRRYGPGQVYRNPNKEN